MARRRKQDYPGWMWMLFGLSIGLSVAFAVYVKDLGPPAEPATLQPASMQSVPDDISEDAGGQTEEPEKKRRFSFYDILPNFELVVPERKPDIAADYAPQAVVEPGVYVLQAGSFSTNADADRRRAELALQGIESHIQRVKVNDKNFHRVLIGPTEDLEELNLWRRRLRDASIDFFRIRLSD